MNFEMLQNKIDEIKKTNPELAEKMELSLKKLQENPQMIETAVTSAVRESLEKFQKRIKESGAKTPNEIISVLFGDLNKERPAATQLNQEDFKAWCAKRDLYNTETGEYTFDKDPRVVLDKIRAVKE